MALKDTKFALTRERRAGAISHYHGTLASLRRDFSGEEFDQRVRTFTQTACDDLIAALTVLAGIDDTAVIVHGVAGCASSALGLSLGQRAYSTNLNERETILGGDEKLRAAIKRASEEGAKAVFILGTPVIAINNDDASSAAVEAEEELGIKVIFLNTDGFKSKTAYTGYDIVFHGLLKRFISAENDTKDDFINVLTVDEKAEDVASVLEIFRDLGIPYNILPGFSNLENLKRAGSARATIALSPSKTQYLAIGLEESFNVPYIQTPAPIGISSIERFAVEAAKVFGLQEKAENYCIEKRRSLEDIFLVKPVAGNKVFLHTETSELEGLAALIRDLGGEIAGFAVLELDRNNSKEILSLEWAAENIPAIVADGQPFEIVNVLSKAKCNFYIAKNGAVSFSAMTGALPVSLGRAAYYGYGGISAFSGLIIKQLADIRPRAEKAAARQGFYNSSWIKKSANWFVKREVK